jgi:hypothetical protein
MARLDRSSLLSALGPRAVPRTPAAALGLAGLFLVAFAVRSLYALDLAPQMYGRQQPGTRMAWRYHEGATGILKGEGVLYPRHPDPARTGLLARPPGYALFVAGVYETIGRSFFTVQAVQNALTALCCVLVVVAATPLAGWRAALLGGWIAALSPHMGYASAQILPDALSALPVLLALLALTRAHPDRPGRWYWSALAGALIGMGVWLRPNVVLLAPFLAVVLLLAARDRRRALGHALALAAAAAAVVLPITIRNYVLFREFVPVSINGGLTLWQGVADAGGEEKGAFRRDKLVMDEEAERYGNPRYREWWAEPDGIWRDRERYRRAREVIRDNPGRYARLMLRRMAEMVHYGSGEAPRVGDVLPARGGADDGEPEDAHDLARQPSDERVLAVGRWVAPLRPVVRVLQGGLVVVLLPLVLVGLALLAWTTPRTTILLAGIPAYYLLTESMFLLEWRVVTPMHYGLFVAAGAAIRSIVAGVDGSGTQRTQRDGTRHLEPV